jgi:molybdopterin-guanine dinucleotide biosynthesis protein A
MNPRPSFNATAIILAGGKSSRMGGSDKALLPVNGIPMIQHITDQLSGEFRQILIGAGDTEKYAFLGHPVISDQQKDMGPLMGILSCLEASAHDINFVTGCDIPVMNMELIRQMITMAGEFDIVMPRHGEDQYEPLFAVYRKTCVEYARNAIGEGKYRITEMLKYARAGYVDFNSVQWYRNLNNKEDYSRFLKDL